MELSPIFAVLCFSRHDQRINRICDEISNATCFHGNFLFFEHSNSKFSYIILRWFRNCFQHFNFFSFLNYLFIRNLRFSYKNVDWSSSVKCGFSIFKNRISISWSKTLDLSKRKLETRAILTIKIKNSLFSRFDVYLNFCSVIS